MPADFDTTDHGLTKLLVAGHNGVVFASFSADTPPLADSIGPKIIPWFERTFDGRDLTLLGHSRQRIPGNWKLMQDQAGDVAMGLAGLHAHHSRDVLQLGGGAQLHHRLQNRDALFDRGDAAPLRPVMLVGFGKDSIATALRFVRGCAKATAAPAIMSPATVDHGDGQR